MTYRLIADGACSNNPGNGGYGVQVLQDGANIYRNGGGAASTTNNIMELRGAIDGLVWIANSTDLPAGKIYLVLDSEYVLNGLKEWLSNWKKNGFKTAARKPVKNQEEWKLLDKAKERLEQKGFELEFNWVKGHNGHHENEEMDSFAVEMRDAYAAHHSLKDTPLPTLLDLDTSKGEVTQVEKNFPAPREPKIPDEGINQMQIDMMKFILDQYATGNYSVRKALEEIRSQKTALGI